MQVNQIKSPRRENIFYMKLWIYMMPQLGMIYLIYL